jgi:hypothetical protein
MLLTRIFFAGVVVASFLLAISPCRAQVTFDYIVVATTDTQIPGAPVGTTFNNIPLPAVRGGNVVFRGEGPGTEGIYAYRGGELEVLVDKNTPVPGDIGGSNFVDFQLTPSPDTEFNVVFMGKGGSGVEGIYTVIDGEVAMIADNNTRIPSAPLGVTFSDFGSPWISDGNIVFRGLGTGGIDGIYTTLGGELRRVASTDNGFSGTDIPDGVGEFTGFGKISTGPRQAPSIGGSSIAFYGEGSGGQQGIYAEIDGTLTRIADTNTAIPGGGGATFPGFDVNFSLSAATYDDGVVFVAGLDSDPFPNRLGIYKWWSGSLMTIADTSTVVSGAGGNLTSFGESQGLSFYKDEYSFLGDGSAIGGGVASPQGVYAILNGELVEVLTNDDTLEGKSLTGMGSYGQGIEDGSVVFNIGAFGNVTANVVAIQEHRWLGEGSAAYGQAGSGADWEDKSNWLFGGIPRTVVPTVIAPDGAATIHGPLADTALASLEVGSGNGVATLWLNNGALITTSSTTIESKGVLAGDGRLTGLVTNHGVIRPDDISTGAIQNHGLIDVATATSRMSTGGASLTNHADMIVNGLVTTKTMTNNDYLRGSGTLDAHRLVNNGEVDLADLELSDTLTNSGLLLVNRAFVAGCADNLSGGEIVLQGENALFDGQSEFHNYGVLRGSGRFVANVFENNNGGEIRVGAGDRMIIENGPFGSSSSVIEVIGGELEFKGDLNNFGSSAIIIARDATLRFGDELTNSGAVAVSFGTTDLFSDINNQAAGTIVVTSNANATFYDDVVNDGTIQVSSGSTAVFLGDFSGANGVSGAGTVFMEGDLRPGNSPAAISFGGDLNLGALAGLSVELGGLVAGAEYDQVIIEGDASLAGALDVSLIDLFTLGMAQTFEILDIAGSRSGMFNGLAEGALVTQLDGVDLFITYSGGDGNDVALFTQGIPGDYNNDGLVDAADYTVWRDNLGAAAGSLPNDVDGGVIGAAQYDTWVANFGDSLPASSETENIAVPEPSTAGLLLTLFAVLGSRRCAMRR